MIFSRPVTVRASRKACMIVSVPDPAKRTIKRITLDDTAAADKIFNVLMGDDVEPRRAFIEENARYVQNLDI